MNKQAHDPPMTKQMTCFQIGTNFCARRLEGWVTPAIKCVHLKIIITESRTQLRVGTRLCKYNIVNIILIFFTLHTTMYIHVSNKGRGTEFNTVKDTDQDVLMQPGSD